MRLLEITEPTAAEIDLQVRRSTSDPEIMVIDRINRLGDAVTPYHRPDDPVLSAADAYREWEGGLPEDVQVVWVDNAHYLSVAGFRTQQDFWKSLGFRLVRLFDDGVFRSDRFMQKGVNGHPTPEPRNREQWDAEQREKTLRRQAARQAARENPSPRWQMLFTLADWDQLPAYTDAAIHDGRKAALEARLMAVEEETRPYRRIRGKLYRGMVLTPSQKAKLLRTGAIRVPQSRIGSWSKARRIAVDFAGEMPGLGIAIARPASALDVLVDFEAVATSRTSEEKQLVDLGYAASLESEVLVRNPEPWLDITRDMVIWDNFRD